MSNKRKYKLFLKVILLASFIFTAFYSEYYLRSVIPDHIRIVVDENDKINFRLPIGGTLSSNSKEVMLSKESNIPSNEVKIIMDEPFSIQSDSTGEYQLELKLFGFLNFKDINVQVVEPENVIPCGLPIGIYLKSDGIMVIGTSTIQDLNGVELAPADGIVQSGDYIVSVNEQPISSKEDLMDIVKAGEGTDVILTIRRHDELIPVKIKPVNTAPDEYKLGIWVRDDTQGIGTLTYVDENNNFGALGHGISDSDTNAIVEAEGGNLYKTEIRGIIKGTAGSPGSLSGVICYGDDEKLGKINKNTDKGIFGSVNEAMKEQIQGNPIPLGYKQDIKTGPAQIICSVDGNLEEYDVNILEVDTSSHNQNKGIVLQVTDKELLEKTGGIVQGMSGSPIVQNGKLIGAVTHVFIQDATKGYGIFIEEMIKTQQQN